MSLRAVIFDMDGVLCSTIDYHFQAWKQALELEGIPFSRQVNEKLRGLSRRRSLEVILDGEKISEERIQSILETKNHFYLHFLQKMTPEDLSPGIQPLLEELRLARIKIGVASGSKNVRPTLKRLRIEHYFEAICDGNISKRSKPDPFPFRYTAALLGQEPSTCLAIEDSPAGVQSAQDAGMCVVGLGSPDLVGSSPAVFPDLSEVHLDTLRKVFQLWLSSRQSGDGDRRRAVHHNIARHIMARRPFSTFTRALQKRNEAPGDIPPAKNPAKKGTLPAGSVEQPGEG